ncbi:MAG: UDP-N-acetylglucosamine 2-epimerase (non-hydrolyzing) [Verrucomicrobiota bacterium JB022]|nr:UDP-N-acetylglucosamine 2-epimerase (non-hydrolyzing) [Verrucomicrobiota bacterium JB022]
MLKILTIVGARPQFVKAATFSRAVREYNAQLGDRVAVEEAIIHTGQHYDSNLSQVFFDELDIPKPAKNLELGGGGHGQQTGRMLEALEKEMLERKPDVVLVYGDTNSTLAGALAAAKLHIPLAHVEAGLRSFNRRMPEEINRVLTDELSKWCFCPTRDSAVNLYREGIYDGVHVVGDVMYDGVLYYADKIANEGRAAKIREENKLPDGDLILSTLHRAENTDCPDRLRAAIRVLNHLADESAPVVLPLHPRTNGAIEKAFHGENPFSERVHRIAPLAYLDLLSLLRECKLVATDSGGLQKEAHFLQKPCLTLRDETEWGETLANQCNQLVDLSTDPVPQIEAALNRTTGPWNRPYGQGDAARQILTHLLDSFSA